jgi:uncharacterized membrane protein YdjX (TVP38/TMEM64 family)
MSEDLLKPFAYRGYERFFTGCGEKSGFKLDTSFAFHPPTITMPSRSKLKKLLFALGLFGATYGLMVIALQQLGLENIHLWIQSMGIFAPIVFILLNIVSLVIAPLSGSSLFVLGGLLFGKELAFWLSWSASIAGCSLNFWISRHWGRSVAVRLIGNKELAQLDNLMGRIKDHHSIFYMIALMPLSQDIVSYAVGLTKVKYSSFLIALVISSAAIVATYIYLGTNAIEWILNRG